MKPKGVTINVFNEEIDIKSTSSIEEKCVERVKPIDNVKSLGKMMNQ